VHSQQLLRPLVDRGARREPLAHLFLPTGQAVDAVPGPRCAPPGTSVCAHTCLGPSSKMWTGRGTALA
jgi:hypothetical protein